MYKYIIVILILLYLLYYFFNQSIESFENNKDDDIKDQFDKEYVNFYEIIYRDYSDVDFEWKIMKEKAFKGYNRENTNILLVGSGVGKLASRIKREYPNMIGIDESQNMVNKSYELNPNIKFKKDNLLKDDKFEKNDFTHIIFDTNTIHYNNKHRIPKILKTCHNYLKEDGKLIIPVLDPSNMSRAARYYTTSYLDDHGIIHGFTYLNNFSHDCYHILDDEDKDYSIYFDKIVLEDGKSRIKKTGMYIPKKEDMFDMVLREGFKVDYIYTERGQKLEPREIGFFTKQNKIVDVSEIEKKK